MTKKDYIKFASMFKNMLKDAVDMSMDLETIRVAITRACEIFSIDNPSFNKETFLNAVYKES